MRINWLTVALALLLAAGGYWFWKTERDRAELAELQEGIDNSRLLAATFVAANALKVGELRGDVQAVSRDGADGGMLTNRQLTRAPATIDYFIELKKLNASDFRWNQRANVMTVELPDVSVGKPNIDMEKARIRQNGVWISRGSGQRLQAQAIQRLRQRAAEGANRPENREKARDNARKAVEDFVRLPLQAAGRPDVRVVVQFPDEARPANIDVETWDRSRPIADVLAEAADKRASAR